MIGDFTLALCLAVSNGLLGAPKGASRPAEIYQPDDGFDVGYHVSNKGFSFNASLGTWSNNDTRGPLPGSFYSTPDDFVGESLTRDITSFFVESSSYQSISFSYGYGDLFLDNHNARIIYYPTDVDDSYFYTVFKVTFSWLCSPDAMGDTNFVNWTSRTTFEMGTPYGSRVVLSQAGWVKPYAIALKYSSSASSFLSAVNLTSHSSFSAGAPVTGEVARVSGFGDVSADYPAEQLSQIGNQNNSVLARVAKTAIAGWQGHTFTFDVDSNFLIQFQSSLVMPSPSFGGDLMGANKKIGFDEGYNVGYNKGLSEAGKYGVTATWFNSFITGLGGLLNVQIFPGISIAFFVSLPLILGVVCLILKFLH